MSIIQVDPIGIPNEGNTFQISDFLHITNNNRIEILIDTLGNRDSRFESEGLDCKGLEVRCPDFLQFEGEIYPILRRPICIYSDDIVTLVQLLEGIAELNNPSNYDAIKDRISNTIQTLSSESTNKNNADEWKSFAGKFGEIYMLRDVLSKCETDEEKLGVLSSAAFLNRVHVHDWEPEYTSFCDVKTCFKSEDLEIYINSREQLNISDENASLAIFSFRKCANTSAGAVTMRDLIHEIETIIGHELFETIREYEFIKESLSSIYVDKSYMIKSDRPPCIVKIHDLPDRELILSMDWERHPNLGKPIRLNGYRSLDTKAYEEVVSSLIHRGSLNE
jgi:hypothetical protein